MVILQPDTPASTSGAPPPSVGAATGVIGESARMREIAELLQRVAPSRTTVLIEGESGTGKEVAAASLHHHSGRSGRLVAINCGSMSPELLDSELFGHAQGAFTGAAQEREGLFVHADGGTLFLDEIGELPAFLQAKLLRVLETLQVRPVGADDEIAVDVRIVAATNRDLGRMVDVGSFREDLYYRLNVLSLSMPPLRERPEDVAPLVDFFARQFSVVFGLPAVAPTRAGLRRLEQHAWPGNVRELRNLVERAILLGKPPDACLRVEKIDPEALQALGASGYPSDLPLIEVKRRHMQRVLAACSGNKSEAARRMGVSRKTLERRLREYVDET
tara:strand:- start:2006 stop:3001 length:996 start_codon:yes stop_codon:yes gene_type:complete